MRRDVPVDEHGDVIRVEALDDEVRLANGTRKRRPWQSASDTRLSPKRTARRVDRGGRLAPLVELSITVGSSWLRDEEGAFGTVTGAGPAQERVIEVR